MIAILVIIAYILLAIVVYCSFYIVFGYDKSDYCSVMEDGHVEYCLITMRPIPCDTTTEQLLCKELASVLKEKELEK